MSGYSSIWVKINHPDDDLLILHEHYNKNALLPEGFVFACAVKEADDETPTESMQALSQQFGEAVFMCVQTTR